MQHAVHPRPQPGGQRPRPGSGSAGGGGAGRRPGRSRIGGRRRGLAGASLQAGVAHGALELVQGQRSPTEQVPHLAGRGV